MRTSSVPPPPSVEIHSAEAQASVLNAPADIAPARPHASEQRAADVSLFRSQISVLLTHIDAPASQTMLRRIFGDLACILEHLNDIENDLVLNHDVHDTLARFKRVREEALALVIFIESQALHSEGLDEKLFKALDGISYAITHELRRVFRVELIGLDSDQARHIVRGRIIHSHGLLSNCFQQSTISLANVFDSTITGAMLFDDLQLRLQQSLVLCRDLWKLTRLVERAEANGDDQSIIAFVQGLSQFRHGSMHYLMYKDWEEYEIFERKIMAANSLTDLVPMLGPFLCYLEALYGHVRMRAALKDHPIDFSDVQL